MATKQDCQQLLSGIPFSYDQRIDDKGVKMIFQSRQISESTFNVNSLQQLNPAAIIIIIPKDLHYQQILCQVIKQCAKQIRAIKLAPIIGLMDENGFQIQSQLVKVFTETNITTEFNKNQLYTITNKLISIRVKYSEEIMKHIGEDYQVLYGEVEDKQKCMGV